MVSINHYVPPQEGQFFLSIVTLTNLIILSSPYISLCNAISSSLTGSALQVQQNSNTPSQYINRELPNQHVHRLSLLSLNLNFKSVSISLLNVNLKRHLLVNVQIRVTHAPHTQLMVTGHRHSEVHFDLLGLVSHSRLLDSVELSGL